MFIRNWPLRLLRIVIALGLLAWLLTPGIVKAISDPDSITIEDVRAYDSVLEADDLLVVVEYNLPYASLPTEIISDAYLGRFLRATTELKSVEPFAFNDKGYGRGIYSFYWTATQKTDDSIEFDDPNAENYQIVLQGKVGVFTGTVPSITGSSIDWQDSSQTTTLLFQHIEQLARKFENDPGWNDDTDFDDLIESPGGTVQLTSGGIGSGEEYFSNTIPQLGSMIPTIFTSALFAPDFSEKVDDRSLETEVDRFWEDNWVDDHFEFLSTQFRAPKRAFTALIAIVFMGIIAFFCANLLGQSEIAAPFGIMTMAVTFPMFGAINFFPLNMVITVAFVMGILGLGWVFFLRRAGG